MRSPRSSCHTCTRPFAGYEKVSNRLHRPADPACALGAVRADEDEPGTWAFQPARDEFRPDALLDLRSLNEKQAGESGFVKVDANGDFVLGNGKPVRFWAVNTNVGREKPFVARPLWPEAEPDLAHHARFLAKRGVNMVRLHAHLNPEPNGQTDRLQPGRTRLDLADGRGHEERGHLRDHLAVLGGGPRASARAGAFPA